MTADNAGRSESDPSDSLGTILVVDDSDLCLDVVRLVLEDNGFHVVTLNRPDQFLQTLALERPLLALIDISLQGASGDQLVESAKASRLYACPMVLYSDRPEAELMRIAARCGASGYVRKGSSGTELVRVILRLVEAARMTQR